MSRIFLVGMFFAIVFFTVNGIASAKEIQPAGSNFVNFDLSELNNEDSLVPAMKIVGLLTILSIAPAILLMMTSFSRILIVLSFIRMALGTQNIPPNQIIVGLALFLTMFTMSPVWNDINSNAIQPYINKGITQEVAYEKATAPLHRFMLAQTREDDLKLFYGISESEPPKNSDEIPLTIVIPSFMVSELKTAFQIGFFIYVPFLVVDMVISSILMAMGMMMLPPTVVALPFKLVLFILVDGWSLIVESLVKSFQMH